MSQRLPPSLHQDESGATAEERQNDQNAGLEGGEDPRPESRPLLQETQAGMSKACPPGEDEDRGLGDSLPNTTSSSQTSLSALPTVTASPSSSNSSSRSSPHPSPTPTQTLLPTAMVRGREGGREREREGGRERERGRGGGGEGE